MPAASSRHVSLRLFGSFMIFVNKIIILAERTYSLLSLQGMAAKRLR
jgi:hypothetical protein